jgi:integrase/recombinase XerC
VYEGYPALLVVRRGKGGNPGTVPIGPVLEDELRRLPTRGWLFPKMDGTVGPLRAWSVSHLANDHLHRIGSSHTLHSCRHRFGTMVYRLSGGDLRLTQEMMRHASPVSTAIYTEVDQGHAAGVVAALPAPSSAPLAAVS